LLRAWRKRTIFWREHHHLMIAFTIVSIIHEQVRLILGMGKYGKAKLRPDASLLQ
jgi:hypothetical protein